MEEYQSKRLWLKALEQSKREIVEENEGGVSLQSTIKTHKLYFRRQMKAYSCRMATSQNTLQLLT